ncbi:MAG: right-handed parallel beta-helix repeat-containing protein [Planctomycetes bacterium]|nr:right-handed parallel beta-helix repeat-containing protein [Planctomycetota bacterium]
MRTPSFLCLLSICLPGVSERAAAAADVHVSPRGDDHFSGKLAAPTADRSDGPVASIRRAQQLAREIRRSDPDRRRPITVEIRGGSYFLEAPILFEPEDSGTASSPVIYRAAEGERPVLSGGRRISGWTRGEEGRWRAQIEDAKGGKWVFSQLFVDDQRRFRPRLPKEGYYSIAEELPPSPRAGDRGHDTFGVSPGQLRADWKNLGDVEVVAFHQWSASRMRIAGIDAEKNSVSFTGHTLSSGWWGKYLKGHRFFVANVAEALDRPGEWYLDRPAGELTYIPREGESPESTEVIAPRLDQLVIVRGDVKERRWVEHIRLQGLTFAHTRWSLPPEGQAFPQADIGLSAAITARGARDVAISGCAVRHTGGYAIAFGSGCRNNRVEDCELVDLAGGGIKIGHEGTGSWGDVGRVPEDPEEIVSHHTVRNCLIAHGGRLHPASVGVWIGHSPHNTVEHNDVFDLYYTGFSVGWIWGYRDSHAHHNRIAFNHVHTIGQGVLSDMGAIYTLGVSPGTVIENNHFHDVRSFSYGGWGLYTDEGSSGILMRNNLVYRCSKGAFHQHYGKENRITNNILAFSEEHQIQRTRTEEHISFFFEKNIVYWDNESPLLGGNWKDNNFRLDRNIYWNVGRPIVFPGGLSIEQWREERKQDIHSLIADPLLADPKSDDFRLRDGSPALGLGFEPFDASLAGRKTPRRLTAGLPAVPRGFD